MKIIYVVQSLGKGGAERLILDVCNELKKNKTVETLIVSLGPLNKYPQLTKDLNIVICDSKVELSLTKKNLIELSSFIKIVKDFKPNIIHSNVYISELISREHLFDNVKYFTHCHNNMPEFRKLDIKTFFNKSLLTKFYEKKRLEAIYKKSNNQFIAISNDTYNFFNNNLPRSLRKNIHLLPNAIDYQRFYYPEKREIANRVNLVMVGHLSDYKNQTFLINVLDILRKQNINAYLTLIGDWLNNGVKIQQKATELGLAPFLFMPGLIEDVETELKKQHIYVHGAYFEAFGLVIIEAMASGLPIVCLDAGGNRDLIKDGENGFILKEHDSNEFAKKIIALVENKSLYQHISENAQKHAKLYDIKQYVNKLLKLYENAIGIN